MLDRLGNKRFLAPIAAVIGIFCMMSLVVYPMLVATPRNVPMGIVSLDAGAQTPKGVVNAGQAIVEKLDAAASDSQADSPVAWVAFESESAARAAIDDGEIYGSLVIPADFTSSQMAAQAGTGEAQSVEVTINQGKNPSVAQLLNGVVSQFASQAHITADVHLLNNPDIGGGMMSAISGVQMAVMPLFIMTMMASILIYVTMKPARTASRAERLRKYATQLAYAAILMLVAASAATLIVGGVGGLHLPAATMILFLWCASFCLSTLFIGMLSLAPVLGGVVIFACFSLGTSTAMLARELLPHVWADWVYPWAPQRFMGEGLRSIVYAGGGGWTTSSPALLIFAAVGLLAFACAAALPVRDGKVADPQPSLV